MTDTTKTNDWTPRPIEGEKNVTWTVDTYQGVRCIELNYERASMYHGDGGCDHDILLGADTLKSMLAALEPSE